MNGAISLVNTLLANQLDVCFTNPGTSEMHFVAALDQSPAMRGVLCLFEGVATGAADGYARMAERPAATLLHLGPGLGNGLANIHNAKRAGSPMVNIVGDHATYHLKYDAPLTSDIAAIARPVSHWVESAVTADEVAELGAEAVAAARRPPGQIATLILPANTAWDNVDDNAPDAVALLPAATPAVADERVIADAAQALGGGEPCLLLLGGRALRRDNQRLAAQIAALGDHIELLAPVSNARIERGAGSVAIQRVPYPVDQALQRLAKFRHVILIGSREPVAFFAYPEKPGRLLPQGCTVHRLAAPGDDIDASLQALAERLGVTKADSLSSLIQPVNDIALPSGELSPLKLAQSLALNLPEQAIIVDESISAGRDFFSTVQNVPPHDWLQITGGAIGIGPPLALGAAVACPERRVIALQADGSAMYTPQALWSQAREGLNVTTIILANRAYAILQGEMRGVQATPGAIAQSLMSLDNPPLDWVSLAKGMGVDGERVASAEAFTAALRRSLATPGPYLIEALL